MAIRKTEKAMDQAVQYLSFKSRTASEMVNYLKKKNVEDAVINDVMEKLMEYRYINDREYLKNYVANNAHLSRYGSKRMIQDLRRRGISDDLILSLEDLFPKEAEYSCCADVAKKSLKALKGQTVAQKRKKLYDKLGRMGYPSEMVLEMIRSLSLEEEPLELSDNEMACAEMKVRDKLNRDYEKYARIHGNKGAVGKDLAYRMMKSLMGRGYPYEMIKEKLEEMKEE